MTRTRKLPGSYSDAEISRVEEDPKQQKLKPVDYVRKRLGLPIVKKGAPRVWKRVRMDSGSGSG